MKKLLCVILSLIIVFSSVAAASAAVEAVNGDSNAVTIERVETENPVIVVRGMNFAGGLQFDRGTENARPVNVQFDFGQLFKYLTKTLAAVISSFSIEAGVSVICEYVVELFSAYPCDNNGDSLYPEISAEYYPLSVDNYPEILNKDATDEISLVASLAERYGAENVYYFVYDWRLDPQDNADLLDETVNTAIAASGSDKVDIICCSMGGSITAAYMAEYGYSKLDTVISNTSVIFGTDVITDLFQGRVEFDADALVRYIDYMVPELSGFVKVLSAMGIVKGLCNFVNSFSKKYEDIIYEETLIPTFATLPGFWSMMKGDEYLNAREFIFGGKEDEYAGLLTRLDGFYNNVSSRRQELIDGAINEGVKFYVIANYNTPMIPAYENAKYQSDGVVETAPMSGGALTSVVGSALTDEQLAVGEARYVSPDKCINASTCYYPDQTWFIKDAGHVIGGYASDCVFFIFNLIESDTQGYVTTWAKYPQFMLSDENETLSLFA